MELASDVIRPPHPLPPPAPTIISWHLCHFIHVNLWEVSHFFYLLSSFIYYTPFCVIHANALIDNYIRQTEQMHSIITYNLQLKYCNSNK